MNIQPTEKQKELTNKAIRRIAELRIKALGLDCTVDEYIVRTQEKTENDRRLHTEIQTTKA